MGRWCVGALLGEGFCGDFILLIGRLQVVYSCF